MVHFQIFGHVAFGALRRIEHHGELLRLFLHLDRVAVLHQVGRDVDALAVHRDVAVVDQLARGERGDGEFHAVADRVEPALQQFDQLLRGVAAAADGFLVVLAELLLADVAVVALQLLLGHQLGAVVGGLLAALAVLAGAVFALGDGGFARPQRLTPRRRLILYLLSARLVMVARCPLLLALLHR